LYPVEGTIAERVLHVACNDYKSEQVLRRFMRVPYPSMKILETIGGINK